MITIRTLPQLKSFIKRHPHLKASFRCNLRRSPGFRFTMVREEYQEHCSYGDHEWVLHNTQTIHRVLFLPKQHDWSQCKRYLSNEARQLIDPDYRNDMLPF